MSPPQPFSRKLVTAKPTICAQQPAVAAPAASIRPRPAVSPSGTVNIIAHSAAEDIGAVSASPTTTDTIMPIGMGLSSVAQSMNSRSAAITRFMPGAHIIETSPPTIIVAAGITMMSTRVLPATRPPASDANTAARYAPTGPPWV